MSTVPGMGSAQVPSCLPDVIHASLEVGKSSHSFAVTTESALILAVVIASS